MNCIRALISGRVQGVFFRDSTRREANRLGIVGHAVNLPDGRVEVLACGEPEALEALITWLHHGPELARVTAVSIGEIEAAEPPAGFRVG